MVYMKKDKRIRAFHDIATGCRTSIADEIPSDNEIVEDYLYSISMTVKKRLNN